VTFFNKKEEVIDLELTPYGETLLSLGIFKPAFYAFYDDDVLYDAGGAAAVSESQNDIEGRIQENTPQSKTQYIFEGAETSVGFQVLANRYLAIATSGSLQNAETAFFVPSVSKDFSLSEPMGSMELGSPDAPSWNIQVLKGELSGAINYLTSSLAGREKTNVKRIPQLDFKVRYSLAVGNRLDRDPAELGIESRVLSYYSDNTYIYYTGDFPELIFSVDEENASVDTEYDIEFFMVEPGLQQLGGEEILIPLKFTEPIPEVVDGLLLDPEERATTSAAAATSDMAEYYFNIETDLEIPEEEICGMIMHLRSRGIDVDDIPYDCPDILATERVDIYGTNNLGGEEC
jgi:hypothetical protein